MQEGPLRYVQYGADQAIGSPPHCHGLGKEHTYADDAKRQQDGHRRIFTEKGIADPYYGKDKAQLGNMKAGDVAAVVQGDLGVASPPFMTSTHVNTNPQDMTAGRAEWANGTDSAKRVKQDYADYQSYDNLGKAEPTTFWEAAFEIVAQTFQILKPGAHAVWVTKHYIRDSQLVDFPGDWRKLCEAVGFQTLHIHLAMLVERRVETHLFEGERTYEQWQESFFRRLSRKRTGVGIEFETVICQVKPLTAAPMPPDEAWEQLPLVEVAECSVSSPAYGDGCDQKGHDYHPERMSSPLTGTLRSDYGKYGTSPAQLGAMPVGSLDCALASPPFADSLTPGNRTSTHEYRQTLANDAGHGRLGGGQLTYGARYSFHPLNLGNLPEGQKP